MEEEPQRTDIISIGNDEKMGAWLGSYGLFQFNGLAGEKPRRESAPWLSSAGAMVPGGREFKWREAPRKESGLKLVGNRAT